MKLRTDLEEGVAAEFDEYGELDTTVLTIKYLDDPPHEIRLYSEGIKNLEKIIIYGRKLGFID